MDSKIYLRTLLFMLSTMGQCQQSITCEAGRFQAGQTAFVTCNFHRSVKDIGHHIYVVQFPLDAPDDHLGNEIVRCFRSNGHELVCDAAKGVQMNNNITDRLTFRIPEVTTDFAGRYMCQLVPPDNTVMVPCSLTVKGTFTQNQTEITAQPEGIGWIIIAAITVACFLCILFGISCFYLFRKRRNSSRRKPLQYDVVNRKDLHLHEITDASFGQADCNEYIMLKPKTNFNYEHCHVVSGQPDSPFCQDASFEPIKHPSSSTCQTGSHINSTVESQNNQINMHTEKIILTLRSDPPSSVPCRRDYDSSYISMHLFRREDDSHSGNETDDNCTFYSSRQSNSENESRRSSCESGIIISNAKNVPSTLSIVSDQADSGREAHCRKREQCTEGNF